MENNDSSKHEESPPESSEPKSAITDPSPNMNSNSNNKPPAPSDPNFDAWIDNFYKECGREVTLAYTTLNQMQNWAVGMIAASIAATVALTKVISGQPNVDFQITVPLFIVAVIAYVYNLRFFIRAILCYINLIRWNTLQNDIVRYKIGRSLHLESQTELSHEQNLEKLVMDIRTYYLEWLSPINRSTQLFSNLKLGFYLIFAFPLLFVIIGVLSLWSSNIVKGFTVFAAFDTFLEFYDFTSSRYFDTEKNIKEGKGKKKLSVFPIPISRSTYFILWIGNLIISTIVVFWSPIQSFIEKFTQVILVCFR